MRSNRILFQLAFTAALVASAPAHAATFGNVVTTVGGHPADIALDESRGKLYIANFTALEIDVMCTKIGPMCTNAQINRIITSIPLTSHPSGLALSPDSNYLVVTEYQNGISVPQGFDGVTVINCTGPTGCVGGPTQNFTTGDPALGVAFVKTNPALTGPPQTGVALVATGTGIWTLDPVSGQMLLVSTIAVLGQQLPVKQATFPAQITEAQLTASADGLWVWGIGDAGKNPQLIFRYNARLNTITAQGWSTAPLLLPRVSVAPDGSWAMIGWTMFAPEQCGPGFMIPARYTGAVASTNVTGHAVNNNNGATDTIYAQIFDSTQPSGPPYYPSKPAGTTAPLFPTLSIMDSDNLTVRGRLYLPENLVGRALLDSTGNNMYAISDSGVTVLPLGSLNRYPRLAASQEDVLVQTNFCNRNPLTTTFQITDPGNNGTDFQITSPQAGVLVVPASGKTPATITVSVQPGAIPNPGGTLAVPLTISSQSAVNAPPAVRLLISNPDLDQRGTIVNVPGQLVDLLADMPNTNRNHFYVLRQDKNQALVFDGSSYKQLATFRTPTAPTGMSFTNDGKYLMIAGTGSQLIAVYDLDALLPQTVSQPWWSLAAQPVTQTPIQLPASHYGASMAQSNVGTFALVENDGPGDCAGPVPCAIDRLDLASRCAYSPQALGIYQNSNAALPSTSVLSPAPGQNSILVAAPNGNVMLYDATHDTFILSRQDVASLSGAYAASPAGASSTSGPLFPTEYVIGDNIFDSSLVPQGTLDTSVGTTAGFTFTGSTTGYRVTGTTASAPGAIQNLRSVQQAANLRAVRTVEAPILSSKTQPFTRTVALLANGATLLPGIAVLTTSGVSVLAPNYDAAVAAPSISDVKSAADGTENVAPGGLISVYGQQMSPVNMATSQIPLPTALGGSCLSVNGVPVPLLFVSSQQVNAQLPFTVSGPASMSIHTPGGISNSFTKDVLPTAPAVFTSGSAGPVSGIATVVRADNGELITPTNPIHPRDTVVIYLTGMGTTVPQVDAGLPGPSSPLASVTSSPTVMLGGHGLQVQYAGLVPGEVGVYQINAYVFDGVPQGLSIPLVVNQGGVSTTLNVRVVE